MRPGEAAGIMLLVGLGFVAGIVVASVTWLAIALLNT